ncbi:enoyl-CoA hydratase/isomerase family protein [Microbacterium gorillae]|uniref:enoyl-CoA hydratase/isomerase family protein n=1 Tax=Microbacterium gorillae TaxID=1231063 RepID=UPI00058E3B8D|nr:enoyl-CoA hydratase-related protein [Microbacterium gorillae]
MIDLSIDGGVAEIVLNRPERLNTLNEQALRDLATAYGEAEAAGVRALVLRGEGRAFCAGRDIAGVDPATDDVDGYLSGLLTPLLERMAAFPAPTFAAAQGAALGVGLGLLIATDVVYLGESAKIGSPFGALGAILDSGGHDLFRDRLGSHLTLDLIYTGRMLSGAEAVSAGLFSRVLPDDELLPTTRDIAAGVSTGPTAAFVRSKRMLAKARDQAWEWRRWLDEEARAQAQLRDTADYREGFRAFQAKERPTFTGR